MQRNLDAISVIGISLERVETTPWENESAKDCDLLKSFLSGELTDRIVDAIYQVMFLLQS